MNVHDLPSAYEAYWAAKNRREHQAACHEILLFGGVDGYRSGWRMVVARWLRKLALLIEQF